MMAVALTGDDIAAALTPLNLDPRTQQTALAALVAAQVTRADMQVVLQVGGAHAGDTEDEAAAWRALAEMIATGMDADTIQRWRATGLSDVDIDILRDSLPVEVVAECAEADPRLPNVLGSYLPLLWRADIPASELGMWARAGLLTADAASFEDVVDTIASWRAQFNSLTTASAPAACG